MGMDYAEEPFNMGMFVYLRHPSKFSDPHHTHTSGHFYTGVAPPPPPVLIHHLLPPCTRGMALLPLLYDTHVVFVPYMLPLWWF